ncbi:MAG TPA: methyltransferase [Chitinophaga sp.]|uniref:methyltransferase n=1 Tax=Chitinophaga sp. TaxID=1869181 RepID=UPI002C7EEE48|nr:methyltransferase [Chitinophaga sp.]HVI47824.1 methyltransferase [Chitinophaga sp.]
MSQSSLPSAEATSQQSARILKYVTDHWISCSVYMAAKLNIAEILTAGPKDITELASCTNTHTTFLYRLLRTLAREGIFEETTPGTFAMTEMATALLGNITGSLKSFLLTELGGFYSPWGDLYHSMQPDNDGPRHYYSADQQDYYHPFMATDTGYAHLTETAVTEKYDFSPFNLLTHIGGGSGSLLTAILKKTPALSGVLFDEPYVVETTARRLAASPELKGRCTTISGSFFREVPTGSDAYLMKYILHDWNNEDASRILHVCSKAMNSGNKLLIIDDVATSGNERTADEFRQLLAEQDIHLNRIIPLAIGEACIIEGEKN